ncbi:MAG TPA: winged helix-turn-helix domain-containing protein [Thermoanaerobaculia bacterium]|nr:winged helix-turn-helix domain-containing protein [Thermoanaerobaculia bacterium]
MIYAFLGMELDEERFELRRAGQPVRLEPRALDVLFFLVRNRDRVVSKEELIEKVWDVKFVSESALHHSIRKVREAIAEATDQEVIHTVHGRGFRFVAPLDGAPAPPPAPGSTTTPGPPSPLQEPVIRIPRPSRRALVAALAAAAVLGALAIAAPRLLSRRNQASSVPGISWYRPFAPSAGTLRQITTGLSTAVKPAFSPDGKIVTYVSYEPQSSDKLDIYVMAAHGGTAWRLTDAIGASGDLPVFTADGSDIVFSRFRSGEDGTHLPDLWRVGSMGGAPRLWIPGASGAGFSADGKLVAYTRHDRGVHPLWGGPPDRPAEHAEIAPTGFVPRFSPDGKWLAFTTSDPNGGLGHLLVRNLASKETKALFEEPEQLYGITWLADNETLIFAGRQRGRFILWMAARTSSRPDPLTLGIGDFSSPTASPDGQTLLFSHGSDLSNLYFARTAAGEGRRLTNDDYHQRPRLSPDGRYVASVLSRTDTDDVVVLTEVSSLRRTTLSEGAAHDPCWVDSSTVAYLVDAPEGSTDVLAIDISTQTRRVLTRFPFRTKSFAAFRDLKRVAIEEPLAAGRRALLVRDLDTGREARLAEGLVYDGIRFSPDGSTLAWSGPAETGSAETNGVFVLGAGGSPRRIAADGHEPAFSADGSTVFFARLGDFGGLWKVAASGGVATRIRPFDRGVYHFDVAGERVLWAQAGGRNQIFSVTLGR